MRSVFGLIFLCRILPFSILFGYEMKIEHKIILLECKMILLKDHIVQLSNSTYNEGQDSICHTPASEGNMGTRRFRSREIEASALEKIPPIQQSWKLVLTMADSVKADNEQGSCTHMVRWGRVTAAVGR